jgi:hypothetical protein
MILERQNKDGSAGGLKWPSLCRAKIRISQLLVESQICWQLMDVTAPFRCPINFKNTSNSEMADSLRASIGGAGAMAGIGMGTHGITPARSLTSVTRPNESRFSPLIKPTPRRIR